jgi:iron complex transport system substrate-binding protein
MPRPVQTDRPRIVSLAPSVTSILFSIGARRDVVGVTKWCKDVAPIGRLPQVGDCWKLDVAEVMKLRPSIIIGSVPFSTKAVERILKEPVAFLALNPRTLADIEANIRTLGGLTNRAPAAEKLIASMRRNFDATARHAANLPSGIATARVLQRGRPVHTERSERGRGSVHIGGGSTEVRSIGVRLRRAHLPSPAHPAKPRVYCEAWPNPRISSPPWVAELVSIAGGEFVTAPGTRITDEDVARANPDLIVLAWTATGCRSDPSRTLRNPLWQNTPAVRNRRVVVIRDELLNTPGPPLMQGARALFRAIRQT